MNWKWNYSGGGGSTQGVAALLLLGSGWDIFKNFEGIIGMCVFYFEYSKFFILVGLFMSYGPTENKVDNLKLGLRYTHRVFGDKFGILVHWFKICVCL